MGGSAGDLVEVFARLLHTDNKGFKDISVSCCNVSFAVGLLFLLNAAFKQGLDELCFVCGKLTVKPTFYVLNMIFY